jgi:hypothetical protein
MILSFRQNIEFLKIIKIQLELESNWLKYAIFAGKTMISNFSVDPPN